MLTSKFWAEYFQVYDFLNILIPYQELIATVCEKLEIQKNEKVLEAGCGTGNLALEIGKRGAEVFGLDSCQEALNFYLEKDKNAKVTFSDLTKKLPFPDNYFDKIACNNTLYTISREEQLKTLKELFRILKPGGKIVIVNPKHAWKPMKIYYEGAVKTIKKNGFVKGFIEINKLVLPAIKILNYNYRIKKESNYYFFNKEEQKEILEKAGFKKISKTEPIYARQCLLNYAEK